MGALLPKNYVHAAAISVRFSPHAELLWMLVQYMCTSRIHIGSGPQANQQGSVAGGMNGLTGEP